MKLSSLLILNNIFPWYQFFQDISFGKKYTITKLERSVIRYQWSRLVQFMGFLNRSRIFKQISILILKLSEIFLQFLVYQLLFSTVYMYRIRNPIFENFGLDVHVLRENSLYNVHCIVVFHWSCQTRYIWECKNISFRIDLLHQINSRENKINMSENIFLWEKKNIYLLVLSEWNYINFTDFSLYLYVYVYVEDKW